MYRVYQIGNNDTLESIASELNTTVEILRKINGMTENMILMPGTYIIVPMNNEKFKSYTVKPGDTIYNIARNNNIDTNLLLKINGLNESDYIYPNQEIIVPNMGYKFYMTKNGDTLKSIMEKLNIDYENIIENNEDIYLVEDQLINYK